MLIVQKETLDLPPLPIADSEAAYLIVGGMGGIGRAIVAWMVEKGAKNLLVVSRTADKHIEAVQLSADARARGCNLQFRSCDISSGENLVSLLADCSKTLPPVRGVVHAAMVLDVSDHHEDEEKATETETPQKDRLLTATISTGHGARTNDLGSVEPGDPG